MFLAFFLSGAAALTYEISWSRQIGLLFGHTIHAASVVLASYFTGMAIGYWIGARLSKANSCWRDRPLIGYAIAEVVVAVWAFAIPILLTFSESSSIAPMLSSESALLQTILRAGFSFLLLLPATVSLGITLPMMADFLSAGDEGLAATRNASQVSFAYAINTAGALVGVLFATFFLLVNIGVVRSSYLAALFSIACAGLAIFVSKMKPLKPNIGNSENPTPPLSRRELRLAAWLSCVSGFGTLALQVLFTRMFSLVFHNSTYTFGIVIAVFLASLAIGAALAGRLQRSLEPLRIISAAMGLGAVFTAGSILVFVESTNLEYFRFGNSFVQYLFGATGLVTVVVAPVVICLGLILPLVWKMAGPAGQAGQVVGRLTAINTLAAAAGAVTASFLLLTLIGLWQSILAIAALYFVVSLWLVWKTEPTRKFVLSSGLSLCFAITVFLSLSRIHESRNISIRSDEQLIQRWNSAYGWIDVLQEDNGAFKIRQNLHYRFGKTGLHSREARQAHLPLLIHNNPKDVLFLGMGTGLTAGSAIPHTEVNRIDVVELIPEVVEAVRTLGDYNFNVVDHPRTTIHIDDARHYLLANGHAFDVIVSDLFVPWESGSGYLYTVEHYEISRKRLRPGGMFCQWLPLYQLGEREFEMIANSFASVFPNTTLWIGQFNSNKPVIALIGTEEPIVVDAKKLSIRFSALEQKLGSRDPTMATSDAIWDHFIGDWNLNQTDDLILNTDEYPRVEFLTPISNRNSKMIQGATFKQYYDDVFSSATAKGASISDPGILSDAKRRSIQRFMMFGR